MENSFTAIFEKVGDMYVAYTEELPGANTQGRTLEEARDNLREAIALVLQSNRQLVEEGIKGKDIVKEEIRVALA